MMVVVKQDVMFNHAISDNLIVIMMINVLMVMSVLKKLITQKLGVLLAHHKYLQIKIYAPTRVSWALSKFKRSKLIFVQQKLEPLI